MTFFINPASFFCDNLARFKAPYRAVLWFRRNHSPEENWEMPYMAVEYCLQ